MRKTRRSLQTGDVLLFKRLEGDKGGPSHRIIYILERYIKPNVKTRIPRFKYLVISLYTATSMSSKIFDKGQGSLRGYIDKITTTGNRFARRSGMKEIDSKDLSMLVQFGSVRNIVLHAIGELKTQRERYIKWYENKIEGEKALCNSLCTMESKVKELPM